MSPEPPNQWQPGASIEQAGISNQKIEMAASQKGKGNLQNAGNGWGEVVFRIAVEGADFKIAPTSEGDGNVQNANEAGTGITGEEILTAQQAALASLSSPKENGTLDVDD